MMQRYLLKKLLAVPPPSNPPPPAQEQAFASLLKQRNVAALQAWLRTHSAAFTDPFLCKVTLLLQSRKWKEVRKEGVHWGTFEKCSHARFNSMFAFMEQNRDLISLMPEALFQKIMNESLAAFQAGLELYRLTLANPITYPFTPSDIYDLCRAYRAIPLILDKLQAYARLPHDVRPSLTKTILAGLSRNPEEAFAALDETVAAKQPERSPNHQEPTCSRDTPFPLGTAERPYHLPPTRENTELLHLMWLGDFARIEAWLGDHPDVELDPFLLKLVKLFSSKPTNRQNEKAWCEMFKAMGEQVQDFLKLPDS